MKEVMAHQEKKIIFMGATNLQMNKITSNFD